MTKPPERIWVKPGMPGWVDDGPKLNVYDVEYTRTDTMDAIKAQVWREAMEAALSLPRFDAWQDHGNVFGVSLEQDEEGSLVFHEDIKAIPNPYEVDNE